MLTTLNERYAAQLFSRISLSQFVFFFVFAAMYNYIFSICAAQGEVIELKKSFLTYYINLNITEILLDGKYSLKGIPIWYYCVATLTVISTRCLSSFASTALLDFVILKKEDQLKDKYLAYKTQYEGKTQQLKITIYEDLQHSLIRNKLKLKRIYEINELCLNIITVQALSRTYTGIEQTTSEIIVMALTVFACIINSIFMCCFYKRKIAYQFLMSCAILGHDQYNIEDSYN
ncbi:MAG: hypothetical protein ACNI27_07100 [Desulfovibrio sp.]